LVCPLPTESDELLETDFLGKAGAVINLDVKRLSLASNNGTRDPYVTKYRQHTALTLFPKDRGKSDEPFQKHRGEESPSDHSANGSPRDKPSPNHRFWLIKMAGEVTVAPQSSHIVTAKLAATNKKGTPPLVCIEPTTIPTEGIIVARAL
jgi:hypothetical protein